jgi:dihydroorotate dehydrogenase (NAD+) catalytic subunit
MADLSVSIQGLHMSNPVMLASGILGETASSMLRVFYGGAGAVVTKSIGSEPRMGHENPTFLEVAGGYINSMGLPNPGIEGYAPELMAAVAEGAVVVGSAFGHDGDEYASLAARMWECGVSAVELNLSCPHASGTGMELGTDPALVRSITARVKETVEVPVLVKLTPNITDIRTIAAAAVEGGADAVVAINTLKAIAIDPDLKAPVLGNAIGGFSGPALKHMGLRSVWDIHRYLNGLGGGKVSGREVHIVGVGGVETGRDAAEYILAGATAVQAGSAVVDGGPEALGRIALELEDWMEAHGYATIWDFRGLAHGRAGKG